jgi:hypothetical protein
MAVVTLASTVSLYAGNNETFIKPLVRRQYKQVTNWLKVWRKQRRPARFGSNCQLQGQSDLIAKFSDATRKIFKIKKRIYPDPAKSHLPVTEVDFAAAAGGA